MFFLGEVYFSQFLSSNSQRLLLKKSLESLGYTSFEEVENKKEAIPSPESQKVEEEELSSSKPFHRLLGIVETWTRKTSTGIPMNYWGFMYTVPDLFILYAAIDKISCNDCQKLQKKLQNDFIPKIGKKLHNKTFSSTEEADNWLNKNINKLVDTFGFSKLDMHFEFMTTISNQKEKITYNQGGIAFSCKYPIALPVEQ